MTHTTTEQDRATTLAFLAEHRRERAGTIAEVLVEVIVRDHQPYRASGLVPLHDLRTSCVDNVIRVLELLALAVDLGGFRGRPDDERFDAARATGRQRAHQGLPLDDVLRSFRIGGRLIWDDLVEQGESRLDASAVRDLGTYLWEVVDETSAQVATSYHRHERSLVRADAQQRAELWEGLLGGRGREPGFAHEAASLLDLPANADLVVVVTLQIEVQTVERELAPHASAWIRRTGDVVGLVALREDSPQEVVQALTEVARAADVAIGISAPVAGLASAGHGFTQAALALRTLDGRSGLAAFDDRLPEALLLSSPDIAERLVDRWLGAVLALPGAEAKVLLDTLDAWVAAGGSTARTAAAVPCHRNTVLNRVRRVAELIGQPLADDVVPVELDLALRSLRMR